MGVIEVIGIRVHAYHGCLPEEARIGGRFRVDVRAEADFSAAEASDALPDTVDYGRVAAIVQAQMAVRSKLIEHAARRILDSLKLEWPWVRFRVRVVKERPPVGGDVAEVAYEAAG